MDAVRQLILGKLDEKGVSMKDASLSIRRNETYVHQFLTRGTPAELGEREREKLGQFLGISPDDLRGPDNPLPSRVNGGPEELHERCRGLEWALRKIVADEPNSRAADTARAALRLYG